ncbi:MAG TPA: hypothetical protein VLD65_00785 [Anaerolineales bacterium]|nr:hypothetical protein [Anaerolineales bacterium]
MTVISWSTFLYLLLLLAPLVFLERFLQREIQAIFLLLTRQPEISMALFSLLFLPGILLHELSHFLMAKLLDVPTGRFSIIPRKLEGGRIQLGYVETVSTDFVRDALIGVAPLVTGVIFIVIAGVARLGINSLWDVILQGRLNSLSSILPAMVDRPDFWLWFYLVFAVSSTMLPSASDRRAWLPLILVMLFLIGIGLLAGIGPWLVTTLGRPLKAALDALVMVLGITVLIHLVVLAPLYFLRKLFSRILGLQVV